MDERAYEVRVAGLVPTEDLLDELGDVEVAEHEFRTVLTGHFADQAALHGFLRRLRAFGLEVVEVRRVAAADPDASPVGTPRGGPTGHTGPQAPTESTNHDDTGATP